MPPCSSDEEDTANVGFIPWLSSLDCEYQKVMHLWRNSGLLETYGDFATDFSRSITSFLVFAIRAVHIKNQLSVLLAGGNVQGNGGRVSWYNHKKGS